MTVLAVALGITPGCLATEAAAEAIKQAFETYVYAIPLSSAANRPLCDQIDARLRGGQFAQTPIKIKIRRWWRSLPRLLGRLFIGRASVFTGLALFDGIAGLFPSQFGQFDARLRRLRLGQSGYAQILRRGFDGASAARKTISILRSVASGSLGTREVSMPTSPDTA